MNDNGSKLAVGATHNNANGSSAGHVRVFEIINNVWTQLGQDIDGDENNYSGQSVCLDSSGSIVAIGGGGTGQFGNTPGKVRVFDYNNGFWSQIGEDIEDQTVDSRFGFDLDLSSNGNILIAGALNNNDIFIKGGKALVFENQNGNWIQVGNDLNGQNENASFGGSVCISDTGVKIGVAGRDLNNNDAGYVNVYGDENLEISDFNEAHISFYPNPTKNTITVTNENSLQIKKIIIYDLLGRLVFEKEREFNTLDISNLANGIFFAHILSEDGTYVKRVVKE